MVIKSKTLKKGIQRNIRNLFATSIFAALQVISAMTAMELILVAYVISIRRTTILFSTIYGYFFFKETRIQERLAGALVIIVGVILISLY